MSDTTVVDIDNAWWRNVTAPFTVFPEEQLGLCFCYICMFIRICSAPLGPSFGQYNNILVPVPGIILIDSG